jgi:hypothetical protein
VRRHYVGVLAAWLVTSLLCFGQGRVLTWVPPDHVEPPFSKRARKAVVNIESQCKANTPEAPVRDYRGTGFLVAYNDARLPKGQFFPYLVTNRHVAECWDQNNRPQHVQSVDVRLNMKDGTSTTMPFANLPWQLPSDTSADLAVTPFPIGDAADHVFIPDALFFTKDSFTKYNIGEGSRILFAGYFYQLEGEHRVLPLLREGILSLIPDTPLITTTGKRGPLYLGDVHIFGGNSGAPVFINTQGSVTVEKGPQMFDDYHLLGIVSGYYYEDSDFNLQIATTLNVTQHANSGISLIVPSDLLKTLLEADSLKAARDAAITRLPKQSSRVQ